MVVGFEIWHQLYHNDLKSRNDLLVVCLHFQCLRRGYVFEGVGGTLTEADESGVGSEMLPNGWNASQDTYGLRYIYPKTKQKLSIKAVKVSDILIASAMIVSAESSGSSLTLQTNEYIAEDFKTYKNAFVSQSVDNILQILDKQLFGPLFVDSVAQTMEYPARDQYMASAKPIPLRSYSGYMSTDPRVTFGSCSEVKSTNLDPLSSAHGAFALPFNPVSSNLTTSLPGFGLSGASVHQFGPVVGGIAPNPNPQLYPKQQGFVLTH